ncbi:MAG: hypothetical protein NC320_09425 [Clostridium sp.]|nr:hypothetical protein [Clostridium sp.]MCM1547984.1 hypothetical protein [Ruminococcus sp.]
MRSAVNFKKMISAIVSVIMMISVFSGVVNAETFTYRTVTYLAGDVDGVSGSSEITFNKVIGTSFKTADTARFSRNGYVLDSWTLTSTNQRVSANATYIMPDEDITFVANWTPATYSVTFTGKGGKTASGESNIYTQAEYGTSITLPKNEFVYGTYSFNGWKYNGVVYNEGDTFEIPAITSGSKIVFAATWISRTSSVTTAPVTTAATTTTTTTSAQLTGSEFVKVFPINELLDFNSEENKMYTFSMNEILKYGAIDKFEINLSSVRGNIGQVSIAVSTILNGQWYQIDCNDYIDSTGYTISLSDKEICNALGSDIQIGYWYGTNTPLNIDSITVTYGSSEPSAKPAATTEATTATTTTTNTTTTTEETTAATTETTTTVETTVYVPETTTSSLPDSQFSKTVKLDKEISMGSMISLSSDEISGINQIIESIELTVRSDNYSIGNYNIAMSVIGKNNSYEQFNFNGTNRNNKISLSAVIPEASQGYVDSNDLMTIGYWWGDSSSVTIESVKVNYRIEKGDFNHDGIVGTDDVEALRKYIVGVKIYGYEINMKNADINNDGIMNVYDCVGISRLFN